MMSTCEIPTAIQGGALGSDAMRQSDAWIYKTTGQTPQTIFSVSIPIGMNSNDWLTLVAIKQGNAWTKNTAINFTTDPKSTTPAALAIIDQNLNQQAQTSEKTLWASSGSITFTDIDQMMGSKITFTTTAANFREIDAQGNDVAGGCASMTGQLQVFLAQSTAVQLVAPTENTPMAWRNAMLEAQLNARQ